MTEGDTTDMIDTVMRELRGINQLTRSGQTLVPRQEPKKGNRIPEEGTEAEAREKEKEPDTDHKGSQTETRKIFGLQKEVNQTILDRMNALAEMLMRGS
jgi:hypothetical protein